MSASDTYWQGRWAMQEAMTTEQFETVDQRLAPLTADGLSWQPGPAEGEFRICQRGQWFVLALDGRLTPACGECEGSGEFEEYPPGCNVPLRSTCYHCRGTGHRTAPSLEIRQQEEDHCA